MTDASHSSVDSIRSPLIVDLHWLDLPESIGTVVLADGDDVLLVDPGPANCVDALREGLRGLGRSIRDVRDVVITHIHLDHAGAAWWWARHAGTSDRRPTVHVHAFGAKHLVDPSKLIGSAERIYGSSLHKLWGSLEPIPEDRVRPLEDGDHVEFGPWALRAIETPGHARHHHAFLVEQRPEPVPAEDRGPMVLTGDAAGMVVPGHPDYVSLPTPPPEFDLEAWLESIERIRSLRPTTLIPTHFGRITGPGAHLDRTADALRRHAEAVRSWMDEGLEQGDIVERYRDWLRAEAEDARLSPEQVARHVTGGTLPDMNVGGIVRYWHKRAEPTGH